ncbi:hypothetical protein [Bacillus sp. RO1]|uniref:hypothetical protein n=1 Tax=Bacillus sp. RO1 TaxID=2722703 RepID=UPI0014578093|nr:hypothetical protein [Bacillus sp. RO1]NLP52156.1 hypothetical protein [Bacillus sp. RO1]
MIYFIIGTLVLTLSLLFWINNIVGVAALILLIVGFTLASLESLNDKLQYIALGVILISSGLFLGLTSAPVPILSEFIHPIILKLYGSLLFLLGLILIGIISYQAKYDSVEKN